MADKQQKPDYSEELGVAELTPKVAPPRMYHVILLNDDYTPMDFVVRVLERFFFMPTERATHIMMEVHTKGKGVCGVFTHEIAETKVSQVNEYAREEEHPLLCIMEQVR